MNQIPVYDGARLHGYTTVDAERFDEFNQWLWKLNKGSYASRYLKDGGTVYMHREVLGLTPGDGLDADHINGDGLDNRRENLRPVTRAQNIQNRQAGNRGARSRYRGVGFCKKTGRWTANVTIDRQVHWLGRHDTEEEAAAAAAAFRARHMPFSSDAQIFIDESEAMEAA